MYRVMNKGVMVIDDFDDWREAYRWIAKRYGITQANELLDGGGWGIESYSPKNN
jgi:hypothetical protein